MHVHLHQQDPVPLSPEEIKQGNEANLMAGMYF
jgi:hypothetical protein